MKRHTSIAILMLILSVFLAANAAASGLEIDRVEIEIDDHMALSTSSDSSDLDVDPGDLLKIRVTLENTFDDDTDNDIEDVKVYAYIDDIDDGDDINDDSGRVTVRADDERSVRLRLSIPEDASSFQDYDLVIRAVGEDQDGVEYSDRIGIDIEVEREDHELIFDSISLSDAACDGDITLRVEVTNAGEEEEEDIELTVRHPGLGTLYTDRFDLYPIDSYDNTYSKTKVLDVSGLPEGRHSLEVTLEYDSGREHITRDASFRKEGCGEDVSETEMRSYDVQVEYGVEPYTNPKRDTSYLFRGDPEVEVHMTAPGIRGQELTLDPVTRESDFSILVLFLADIALLVFVILLLMTIQQHLKE